MDSGSYSGRVLGLLKSLANPPFFLYRIFHYINFFVPKGLAENIYRKNIKEFQIEGVSDYLLRTYDGSGQSVHPDIAYYEEQYWLAVTPYPYGMEEYENPCIYRGDNINNLKEPNGPIAVQNKHTQGVHLSDPCFSIKDNTLYFYYRESERKGDSEEHTIWGLEYSGNGKIWGKPFLIMNSVDDKLLSPAMIFNETGELTIYYVSSLNGDYRLVSTKIGEMNNSLTIYNIVGMPSDYYLWHIGITKEKDIYLEEQNHEKLAGLFLMKSKNKGGGMILLETRNDGKSLNWYIVREVIMPDEIKEIVTFPYKSCFIPRQNGAILLSFRDKKSRNRLIIINNN